MRVLERSIERRFVRAVEAAGGWAVKLASPSRPGMPDRLVLWPGGRVAFVELKAPDGRLSPQQRTVARRMAALGFRVAVIRSAEEVDAFVRGRA